MIDERQDNSGAIKLARFIVGAYAAFYIVMAIANYQAGQYDYQHSGDGQPFYTDALLQMFLAVALSLCALSATESKNSLVAGTVFLVPEFLMFFIGLGSNPIWKFVPKEDAGRLVIGILSMKAAGLFFVARGAFARYRQVS